MIAPGVDSLVHLSHDSDKAGTGDSEWNPEQIDPARRR